MIAGRTAQWLRWCIALCALLLPAISRADDAAPQREFFEQRIRPVLVERCYECHAGGEVQGGLRLDSRLGWQQGGDSGPAVVPGQPVKSLLLQALRYDPTFVEMPPDGQLSAAVIRDFERWIADGAFDPRESDAPANDHASDASAAASHWAYRPLFAQETPRVEQEDWPRDAVDRFVLARLEAAGLQPGPDAAPRTLVRRLYFDLHGLPPTAEELAALDEESSPAAVAALVDALLASPRFGQRWGRHWLDVARYGESLTLRGLILHDAWRYRDYVIDAFNSDRPFDQFVREQVAGDLLTADTIAERQQQCIATTFLGLGNWNLEEQDKQQLRMDVVDEQLDTIGRACLAQTLGCARCHDHKFDPIPTRDYYALATILRNAQTLEDANVSQWLSRPLPLEPEMEQQLAAHESQLAALDQQIKQANQRLAALEASTGFKIVAASELPGIVIDDVDARAVGNWSTSQSNKPYIGRGYLHDGHERQGEKSLTFEAQFPAPGEYEVRLAFTPGSNRASNAPVTVFSAEGERTVLVDQRSRPAIEGRFASLGNYRFEQGGQSFVIVANDNADGHVVADAVQFLPVEQIAPGESAVEIGGAQVSELEAARAQLAALNKQLAGLKSRGPTRPTYLGVRDLDQIEAGHVLIRGNVHQPAAAVERGFLQVIEIDDLGEMPADQSGRLQLAAWLTHPHNPLTARVIVNRVWHWLFGRGLVATVDNFGVTGEAPSHPELLDTLALEFASDGWSIKRLIRRLVLTRTYQLASSVNHDPRDPENRLLAHASRRRLDAECLRDAMLLVSGELDDTAGGPTIKSGVAADYGYQHDHLRRSVYVPVLRNALPAIFEAFDFADPSLVAGRRNTSTVVQQSLYFLHDPFVLDRSRQAAARLLAEPDLSRDERIELLFLRALGRPPSDVERQVAAHYLHDATNQRQSDAEQAAWGALVQSVFASSDFRYVD